MRARLAKHDGTAQLSLRDLVPLTPPPVRRAPSPRTGDMFGAFELHEKLGEGGMAQVHRAERVGANGVRTSCALKRMWPHLSEDADFVEAFVHEARLACSLRHPNIARAYELGKVGGVHYIAMELVAGPTLGQILTQSRTASGAIPLPIVVAILRQLCDALAFAHARQIIHRDVSPANVIISPTGVVKLIDFGIAKAASSRQTQAGIIKGKLAYVAPEYTYGHLDARADLFSVGVVAYELITGTRLMLGESPFETITNIREKPIQPPSRFNPQVSRDLDDVVLTAVQRDPALRWQNAAAMSTALEGVARSLPPVDGTQIRAWIEWAFSKQPRTEHSIVRVLDTLDVSVVAPLPRAGVGADRTVVERPGMRRLAARGTSPTVPAQVAPSPGRARAVGTASHAAQQAVPRPIAVETTEPVRASARRPRGPSRTAAAHTTGSWAVPLLVALLLLAAATAAGVYAGWLDLDPVLARL